MGRQIAMLRGKPTGQVGTIAIGGLSHWQLLCRRIWLRSNCPYDRVRTRRQRLEALAPTMSFQLLLKFKNWRERSTWANNQDRRIYGAVKKRESSWKSTIQICERSCCWLSGDQSLISNFVSICICRWSAQFFNQGVHLHRRSVLD